jgi:two-component system cell cycle sensor histidine kinase/response regulator CckA
MTNGHNKGNDILSAMSTFNTSMPISFEDIVGALPDAVIVHDLENEVLYWNKAAETLYGWSAEEIKGRRVSRIFYLDTNTRDYAVEQLRDVGTWSGELHQIDRSGQQHLIQARQRLFRDSTGAPVAIVSFNADITRQ